MKEATANDSKRVLHSFLEECEDDLRVARRMLFNSFSLSHSALFVDPPFDYEAKVIINDQFFQFLDRLESMTVHEAYLKD